MINNPDQTLLTLFPELHSHRDFLRGNSRELSTVFLSFHKLLEGFSEIKNMYIFYDIKSANNLVILT